MHSRHATDWYTEPIIVETVIISEYYYTSTYIFPDALTIETRVRTKLTHVIQAVSDGRLALPFDGGRDVCPRRWWRLRGERAALSCGRTWNQRSRRPPPPKVIPSSSSSWPSSPALRGFVVFFTPFSPVFPIGFFEKLITRVKHYITRVCISIYTINNIVSMKNIYVHPSGRSVPFFGPCPPFFCATSCYYYNNIRSIRYFRNRLHHIIHPNAWGEKNVIQRAMENKNKNTTILELQLNIGMDVILSAVLYYCFFFFFSVKRNFHSCLQNVDEFCRLYRFVVNTRLYISIFFASRNIIILRITIFNCITST